MIINYLCLDPFHGTPGIKRPPSQMAHWETRNIGNPRPVVDGRTGAKNAECRLVSFPPSFTLPCMSHRQLEFVLQDAWIRRLSLSKASLLFLQPTEINDDL